MRNIYWLFASVFLLGCKGSNEEAQTLNNEGVAYLDQEKFEKAELSFRKAWKLESLDAEVKAGIARNLSLLFSATNQKDSALHYAKISHEAVEKDSYYYMVSKAEYALLRQNVNEARAWFEKAKEKNPNDMAVYNSLGMIYAGKYGYQFEDVQKALENNLKAYALSPRDPLAEALAFSYMNADKHEKSLKLWEGLRKKQPTNMEFLFHEGVALYFSGQENLGKKQICREMYNEMLK